jgi:antitoxin component YwqK of YwqJK toxin-antitoxin module
MMKYVFTFLVAISLGITGCTEEEKPKDDQKEVENLVEVKDGIYTEWYPGKKQIKYRGGQDNEKRRHGVWTFYAETGTELSVTMYEHGLRTGHTVVKYPNGRLHYRGEYLNDKTVGVWTTYDEKGELISEKDFGYPAN